MKSLFTWTSGQRLFTVRKRLD